jgi:Tfp pilus assembly protein PilO
MMLFAVVFLVSAMLPQQHDLSELERQLQAAHQPGNGRDAAPVRLSRFMNTLPRRSELPSIVGQVFKLAAAAQVTLDRGRYELSPMRAGNLAQYRMTFPIKGRYPDIRLFIDSVMTTVPSAALEGLRVERKAVGEETVSADLRLAVFVRNSQ